MRTQSTTRRVGSYVAAIEWIALNDDTLWLDDKENGSASVTLCLVADIFQRTLEEAEQDLRRRVELERKREAREKKAQEQLEAARATARRILATLPRKA